MPTDERGPEEQAVADADSPALGVLPGAAVVRTAHFHAPPDVAREARRLAYEGLLDEAVGMLVRSVRLDPWDQVAYDCLAEVSPYDAGRLAGWIRRARASGTEMRELPSAFPQPYALGRERALLEVFARKPAVIREVGAAQQCWADDRAVVEHLLPAGGPDLGGVEACRRALLTGPDRYWRADELASVAATRVGAPALDVYVVPGARPMAWCAGARPPFVALTSSAAEDLTEPALLFALGHVLAHIATSHLPYLAVAEEIAGRDEGDAPDDAVTCAREWLLLADVTADRGGVLACAGDVAGCEGGILATAPVLADMGPAVSDGRGPSERQAPEMAVPHPEESALIYRRRCVDGWRLTTAFRALLPRLG